MHKFNGTRETDQEEDITYNFFRVIKKLSYNNSKVQNEVNKNTKGIVENIQYLLERNMDDYALQEMKKNNSRDNMTRHIRVTPFGYSPIFRTKKLLPPESSSVVEPKVTVELRNVPVT